MRSSNPVFSRRGFSRDNGNAGFNTAQQPQAGAPQATNPYANNPYAQPQAAPGFQGAPPAAPPHAGRMTMDDVVARTGMTVGLVVVMAAVAWITDLPLGPAIGAALVAMVLALVQAFKRKASPPLILAYAAFEGLFLGAISNYVDSRIADGAAMQAVLGTMAVFTAVLVMYKTRIIRVTQRFYRFVLAAAIGFVLLMGVNLLFAVLGGGDGLGFRSGAMGVLFGVIGIILGACFLALDFKQVEDGIAYGAPREESWMAAFGLTLTLVWIYLEFLRLVAILQGGD
ncbi:Bax inhibitor-1/YccA family protein [Streptomyces sp. N2-109]|uniref:Bax inhibitor-1/YccA family protein n=1 Tax=Streptomyces gossypii TaxID=2883101 RepID=A0ABT2JYG8_9ACTN|nr:Bax inhibitor-1/YccA family protein [Streptomyces gossypii]MCT2592949.1 Bax inhibitor-1/YccA family protein [Streptomyces gossypii]MCT2593682.1 Bax inhibitor-1/YccA family protein [Streptomyces gossypii]